MPVVSDSHLRTFTDAAHRIGTHQLLLCSSGNLSWRVSEEFILISKTGAWLPYLAKDQICQARLSDGLAMNKIHPSIDSGFHFGILKDRKDVNVVLHFQSLYATTLACLPDPPTDFNVINEVPMFIGPVAILPYICPGSPQLGIQVTNAIKNHNLVVLRNHGQVVVGKDFDDVIQKALFFELACGIIMRSNNQATRLNEEQIQTMKKLVQHFPSF